MATLGSLVLEMSANTARLSNDLAAARGRVEKFVSTAKRSLGGLGAALGAAFTVGGVTRLIKNSAEAADALAKLSQKSGLTVETLNGLSLGAERAGSNLNELQNGFRRLATNAFDASKGTGEAKDAFDALGIKVTDASGNLRSIDSLLLDVADRFAVMEDGTTKAALAQDIFGRSGSNLIPLLNQGAVGIRGLSDEALALGGVTTDTAKRAEVFNDNLNDLRRIMQGLGNALLEALVPTLIKLTGSFRDNTSGADKFRGVAEKVASTLKVLASGAAIANAAFTAVGSAIGGVAAAVVLAVQGKFRSAYNALKESSTDTAAAIRKGVEDINSIWSDAAATVPPKVQTITDTVKRLPPTLDEVAEKSTKVSNGIGRQVEALQIQAATFGMTAKNATLYKLALDGATETQLAQARASLETIERLEEEEELREKAIQRAAERGRIQVQEAKRRAAEERKLLEQQKAAAEELRDTISGTLGDEVVGILQGNFKDIGQSFQGMLDQMVAAFIRSQITDMIGGLGSFGSGGGGFGAALGSLFGGFRAIGGAVSPGQAYMVGEHGPELFVPPGAGSIVPNGHGGGSVVVNNHFVIQAPNGRVSDDAQQQVAARTGQAVNRALSRSR